MSNPSSAILSQLAHIKDDKRPELIACEAIFVPLAMIAVALRFMCRRITKAPIGADDWMILVGMTLTIVCAIGYAICIHYGLGRHTMLSTHEPGYAQITIAIETIYSPAIATIKFSILLLQHRIFPGRTFRNTLIAVGGFILCYTIAAVAINVFQCVPLRHLWDSSVPAQCIDYSTAIIVISALNVLTDVVLLSLPLPILWRLKMNKTKKIQITAMFLLGSFVCVISIIRCTQITKISGSHSFDPSWDGVDYALWSNLELCIAIVCACLVTLRPLFIRFHGYSKSGNQNDSPKAKRPSNNIFRKPWSKESSRSTAAYLETNILGSVGGEGKFLKSGDFPELDSLVDPPKSGSLSSHREVLEFGGRSEPGMVVEA